METQQWVCSGAGQPWPCAALDVGMGRQGAVDGSVRLFCVFTYCLDRFPGKPGPIQASIHAAAQPLRPLQRPEAAPRTADMAAEPAGTPADRYELRELVGRGSFGAVHRG